MDDIFISYANEDRDRAAQLATFLETEGWRVWWDRRIPAGRSWRSVLEEAVEDTRCMIVLWSENSVKSPWVAEEAEEARRLGKTLVPVMIQRVEPPLGFRTIQAANLINWDGSADHPAGRQLVADLKALLTSRDEKAVPAIRDVEPAAAAEPRYHSMDLAPLAKSCAGSMRNPGALRRVGKLVELQRQCGCAGAARETVFGSGGAPIDKPFSERRS